MKPTASDRLTIRRYAEADEPAVLSLLATSLAGGPTGERTTAFFRWKHHDNPFGRSLGLVAVDGERIVGVRLVMRWDLRSGEQRVPAGRMVDTATHPSARGRGVFRELTMQSLDQLATDTAMIFNTPNGQSRPGYLKMGWEEVGVVPTSFSPVRPLRFLAGLRSATTAAGATRVIPAATARLPTVADVLSERRDEISELVTAATTRESRLHTVRDLRFLRWRYADAPGLDYRAVPVERRGRLVGLGIGRLRGRGRLTELTLADVLAPAGDWAAARAVLRAARRSGVDHVATHLPPTVARRADLLGTGYLTSARLGLTLTTRALGGLTLPVDPTERASWALVLGDLEVF